MCVCLLLFCLLFDLKSTIKNENEEKKISFSIRNLTNIYLYNITNFWLCLKHDLLNVVLFEINMLKPLECLQLPLSHF